MRLITLNYCPMGCTFCSSTNFLHEAQGGVAAIARLDADECLAMIERIVAAHPRVRTIIFQDDIFVFTKDRRILPLCEAIVAAKQRGAIPRELQFISTNRIDAMTQERLAAMRRAGFRVLGFGIENFSRNVLEEFNKGQIHRHIEPMLDRGARARHHAVPRSDPELAARDRSQDVAETLREAYRWLRQGCEIGMYPYVIPFSGAALSRAIPRCARTRSTRAGMSTAPTIEWDQPAKILPIDPDGERGDPAHRARLRSAAGGAAAARGASALARALAGVDSGCGTDHGRAWHRHCRRARSARRTRGAPAAAAEGDGARGPSRSA